MGAAEIEIRRWKDLLERYAKLYNNQKPRKFSVYKRKSEKHSIVRSSKKHVKKHSGPFQYPTQDMFGYKNLKNQEHLKNDIRKYKDKSLTIKLTYSTRLDHDIKERLTVADHLDHLEGITDVDKKYFSIIEKKPYKTRFNKRDYIQGLRDVLRTRISTGYNLDEIYKIDVQSNIEYTKIKNIRLDLKNYQTQFEECLAVDHNHSMDLLFKSYHVVHETETARMALKEMLHSLGRIKFTLFTLEENWLRSRLCEVFLSNIFPSAYAIEKAEHEGQKKTFMYDISGLHQRNSIFDYTQIDTVQMDEYEDLVDRSILDDPRLLLKALHELELQNLDYLTTNVRYTSVNKEIDEFLTIITHYYNVDIQAIKFKIHKLKMDIKFTEDNSKLLQAHAQSLISLFKLTCEGAHDVVLINELMRQTYEECITKEETDLSTIQMYTALANEYRSLLLELDSVSPEAARQAVKDVRMHNNRKLKLSILAKRNLHEIDTLMERTLRIWQTIPNKNGRKLMFRSTPPEPKKKQRKPPPELKEEKKLYLHFFTEYCKYTDDWKDFL